MVGIQNVEEIFERLDVAGDGVINYSEFLMATVDKHQAITENNLRFAFSHFDVDNTGVITHENMAECFRRQGRDISQDEICALMDQVPVE